jgi:hypothetical protein
MFTTKNSEKAANLDGNWKWFCRACGQGEHECECLAEDLGAEPNDGIFPEDASDPHDIEYDR